MNDRQSESTLVTMLVVGLLLVVVGYMVVMMFV